VAKAKAQEDPLVAKAFDAGKHAELAEAIENLSPEEAQFFLLKLEAALKKRRLQLIGYLVAMLVWLVATVFALVYFGSHEGFTGWVFLVPFFLVGVILFAFGKWAERVSRATLPAGTVADAKAKGRANKKPAPSVAKPDQEPSEAR